MKKIYICKTTIAIRVEAEDETEAENLASLEMDIGDIDWEAEEEVNLEYPLFACEETAQIEAMYARHLSKDENKNK